MQRKCWRTKCSTLFWIVLKVSKPSSEVTFFNKMKNHQIWQPSFLFTVNAFNAFIIIYYSFLIFKRIETDWQHFLHWLSKSWIGLKEFRFAVFKYTFVNPVRSLNWDMSLFLIPCCSLSNPITCSYPHLSLLCSLLHAYCIQTLPSVIFTQDQYFSCYLAWCL